MDKKEIARAMKKFWDEQNENCSDYNSLDIYYKDGSYLKFFIFPNDNLKYGVTGKPVPEFRIAYADEERSLETGSIIPQLRGQAKVVDLIFTSLVQMHFNGVDLEKPIDRVYENVLRK